MSDLICNPGTHAAMCLAEEEHGDTCPTPQPTPPTPPTPQTSTCSSIDVYIYVHIHVYTIHEGLIFSGIDNAEKKDASLSVKKANGRKRKGKCLDKEGVVCKEGKAKASKRKRNKVYTCVIFVMFVCRNILFIYCRQMRMILL